MNMSPEGRAALAEARRRDWADPVKRELKLMRLREASHERARQAAAKRGEEWTDPDDPDALPDGPIIVHLGTVPLSSVPRRDCLEIDIFGTGML